MFGQVGIGTSTPRGALDINNPTTNTHGLVLPTNENPDNITNPQDNGTPVEGTVIYDSTNDCIKFFKGTQWSNCLSDSTGGGGSTDPGTGGLDGACSNSDPLSIKVIQPRFTVDPIRPHLSTSLDKYNNAADGEVVFITRDEFLNMLNASRKIGQAPMFDPDSLTVLDLSNTTMAHSSDYIGYTLTPENSILNIYAFAVSSPTIQEVTFKIFFGKEILWSASQPVTLEKTGDNYFVYKNKALTFENPQNSNTSFVKVGLYSSAPIHKIEDLDVTIGTHIGNISCGTSLNDYIIDGNPAFTALAFFD